MNFNSMEYFIMLANKRNFTKAAEELFITQQTLSSHINDLEKELECQLIIRSRPIELTYAGDIFLSYANKIYEQYQSLWNEFNDITNNNRGKFLIGFNHSVDVAFLAEIIEYFKKEYPNIKICLYEETNESLYSGLMSKNIDLAIGNFKEENDRVNLIDFYSDMVVMVISKSNFELYFNGNNSYKKQTNNLPLIINSVDDYAIKVGSNYMDSKKFESNITLESNNINVAIQMCLKGLGVFFSYKTIIANIIEENKIKDLVVVDVEESNGHEVKFAYRKDSYEWNILRQFMRISKTFVNEQYYSLKKEP